MQRKNRAMRAVLSLLVVAMFMGAFGTTAMAAEKTATPAETYYEFTEKEAYPITTGAKSSSPKSLGKISVKGDFKDQGNGMLYIQSGNVDVSYSVNINSLESASDKWHLTEDKTKEVDGVKLDDNILKGAIIVQSSLDGETWLVDKVYTDAFSGKEQLPSTIFTTKDIHQLNGCFYRVIVAYKLEKQVDSSKILFVNKANYEYMRVAEVYSFFVIDQHTVDTGAASPATKPRQEFSTVINTGKDNGFDVTQAKAMDKDDPHFNKSIGYFTINGYSRETKESDGTPVFLKTLGDEVTLWFTLTEDIDALFGNDNLSIAENKKGYDKAMGVEPTNFKHGALIVKYTDEEGHSPETVKYFDFLAANTMTGADTRIQLYEEGEYEVTLDYKIVDTKGINSYSDYKITFKFSIRNGNTMAFPRDSKTGSELKDGAHTANGFVVDLAESKYLTIDVIRREVTQNADGTLATSVRNNSVGHDGSTYTKAGIYEITVKNQYSDGVPTTVTIYVGNDQNILALAKNHKTVEELNELIKSGTTIDSDGSLIAPPTPTVNVEESVPVEVTPVETETVVTPTEEPSSVPVEETDSTHEPEPTQEPATSPEVTTDNQEEQKSFPIAPIALLGVVAAGGATFALKKKRNGKEE